MGAFVRHKVGGRTGPASAKRASGIYTLEFVLITTASMMFFLPMVEFFRLSLIDQMLAQAAHEGALAVATEPAGSCGQPVVMDALNDNFLRSRLGFLDYDGDGAVDTQPAQWQPIITVEADDNLMDGTPWESTGCGGADSWIRVQIEVAVRPWAVPLRTLWPNGVRRLAQSWVRRQS